VHESALAKAKLPGGQNVHTPFTGALPGAQVEAVASFDRSTSIAAMAESKEELNIIFFR
jgi:hypothetical protein